MINRETYCKDCDRSEEKVVNVGEPVIFENNTDSDFSVSAAIVFRKSGLYDVSIVGRRTIISKVSERIRTVEELSSVEPQQWIPCEERLPEVGTYVLVSKKPLGFRSNLPNVCTAHRSRDPRSGKEEWNDMLFGKLDDDDVLAWMPLPKLYADRRTE